MLALASDPVLGAHWLLKHRFVASSDGKEKALFLAIRRRKSGVMQQLLQMGASATKNMGRGSPLEVVCSMNFVDGVQLLWGRNDVRSQKEAAVEAMCLAGERGYFEIVHILIAQPSPLTLHSVTSEGHNLLHCAAAWGTEVEMVRWLLSQGVSCTARSADGQVALHCCCFEPPFRASTQTAIARLLLNAKDGLSVLDLADSDMNTPLHHAAANGLHDICELLLRSSSQSVEAQNNEGYTPLRMARRSEWQSARLQALLVAHGAVVPVPSSDDESGSEGTDDANEPEFEEYFSDHQFDDEDPDDYGGYY